MRIPTFQSPRFNQDGIALIIVMIVIVVLGVLAGGFAYSMRVETKLAGNASVEPDLEWLGRSGVELARYVLAMQLNARSEPYTGLNQKWAGGIGVPEELMADIFLENVPVGLGRISIKITDMERKLNINMINAEGGREIFDKAMLLMGGDVADSSVFLDSLKDWIDRDEQRTLNGAESDDYLKRDPPYYSKNGPLDNLSELFMIEGMVPELYWGAALQTEETRPSRQSATQRMLSDQMGSYSAGFKDVFTTVSNHRVNLNTTTSEVLQLLPGIDPTIASGILQMRAGYDGADGTEDDIPFRSVGELINVPGMNPDFVTLLSRYCDVHSFTFEVEVKATIGQFQRTYKSLLRRESAREVRILYFTWD